MDAMDRLVVHGCHLHGHAIDEHRSALATPANLLAKLFANAVQQLL
jgi:hypothetical protein